MQTLHEPTTAELAEQISRAEDAEEEATMQAGELERRQAIIDKLPKTADDVPVVPGKDRVFHPNERCTEGNLQALRLDTDNGASCFRWYLIQDCYSTREAAEAAGMVDQQNSMW